MNPKVKQCSVPIGDFEWYPLKLIGDKYFITSTKPLFKGYYALSPCDFQHSQLNSFLGKKFMAFLENDGVDTSKISLMSVMTQGQYNLYVYDKLPACGSFLLQTPAPGKPDHILAAEPDGSLVPVHVTEKMGIRPCCFIDKAYLESIQDDPIKTTEEFYKEL